MILIHELAHASIAYLLRIRVFRIILGYGKTLYARRFLGITWELRVFPLGGVTLMAGPPSRFYRLKMFLAILAGPAVHITLLTFTVGLSALLMVTNPKLTNLRLFIGLVFWCNLFLLLENIAYTNILINRVDLLQEAAIYSAEAYQNAPWEPAIIGTRGAVLVELGQLDEGIMLLKVAMAKHSSAQGKAANACHAAIGESRRGNVSESQHYFHIARSLDPQCYLLEYTAKKLAGTQG